MEAIMYNFKFILDFFIAANEWIHIELFLTLLPLPYNSIEHLTLAQYFKDNGLLNIDESKVEQVLMILLINL